MPPHGFFNSYTMTKKKSLMRRTPSLETKLQLERQNLKAIIYGDKILPHNMTRLEAVHRLREINTELNKLYAARQ